MLDLSTLIQRSLILTLLMPGWVLANNCFPAPDSSKPQYLVAFGSLLYEEARLRKVEQTKLELPVWVQGYKRAWQIRTKPDGLQMTNLGITPADGERFNGVLMSLSSGKLASLDRHAKLECRVKIKKGSLQSMAEKVLPNDGDIWIYQVQKKHVNSPAGEYPIVQSNVDVFLTGCIEQSDHFKIKDFADLCVSTTQYWSTSWVNDRRDPIDKKIVQTKNKQVDQLLEKLEDNLYESIREN